MVPVRPTLASVTAVPVMIWSAPAPMATAAKSAATSTPARMPTPSPAAGPATVAPMAPPSAPKSIAPSTPRFTTPDRSAIVSPVAASASGVAMPTAATSTSAATAIGSIMPRRPITGAAACRSAPRRAAASPSSSTRMITPSTTYTATAGIPASRCIAPAPASSAAKTIPVSTMADGRSRASRATPMAVKP